MKKWVSGQVLVLATAIFLFSLRFLNLRGAPFVNDEPLFQMLLDEHFKQGNFPVHALFGSRGVPYGPTVLWMYGLVRIFTDQPAALIFFSVFLSGAALAMVYWAIRRSIGPSTGPIAAAWGVLLLASSPFLYFYARMAWDVPLLVFTTSMLALALAEIGQGRERFWPWALLGFGAALSFNTHLMSLGVIGAAGICALLALRDSALSGGFRIRAAGLAGAVFLAPAIPYLAVLASSKMHPVDETAGLGALEALLASGEGIFRYLSPQGMEYFLQAPLTRYLDPVAAAVVGAGSGVVIKALCAGLSAYFLVELFLKRFSPKRLLLVFAVSSFFLTLVYYIQIHLTPAHPHYFMPTWWVGATLLSFFYERLPRFARGALGVFLLASVSLNVFFSMQTFAAIQRDHGTRGIYYGSSLGETESAVSGICRKMQDRAMTIATVDLSKAGGSLEPSFNYLAVHAPECMGRAVKFSKAGTGDFELRYPDDAPSEARLVLAEKPAVAPTVSPPPAAPAPTANP